MKKSRGFGNSQPGQQVKLPGPFSGSGLDIVQDTLKVAQQHREAGHLQRAEVLYRQVLQVQPSNPEALYHLGAILLQTGRTDPATQLLHQAVLFKPDWAEAHLVLGNALRQQGKVQEAAACYRQALVFEPGYAAAHNNLGSALLTLGNLEEAATSYQQALSLDPTCAGTYYNWSDVLKVQGQLDEAIACYRRALSLKSDYLQAHDNLLMLLQYHTGLTPQVWQEALAAFAEVCAPISRLPHFHRRANPEKRLRVGYVSPDMRSHSCAWFFEPLLAAHDRTRCEIFCYADVLHPDAVTARLQSLSDHWHNIVDMPHPAVAQLIQSDGIDILVDMAGHTAGNRLPLFAARPAPVQVNWLGFPGSTGLDTIDYRLSDPWLTPEPVSEYFIETVWNLERVSHCYRPPAEMSEVGVLPALTNGYITFGSFNNLLKTTPETIALWAEVLRAVPESRLLLKGFYLLHEQAKQLLVDAFARQGIEAGRLELSKMLPGRKEHLDRYGQVDIGLDTTPYNGATTTMEALWMGVPVVTRVGDRTAARYGWSFLSAVGLEGLAAESPRAFVEAARGLAEDWPSLAALRQGLRERVMNSPLRDERGFAQAVEDAYRQMWRRWCANRGGLPRS
ncbi:MAG: tetratricopeptide repeat protein [Gemmatimonadaceae bacterium]|nr:tetratricopeptide repeat protein [Gloeobacterales cyanobacterium ES-bin-141]